MAYTDAWNGDFEADPADVDDAAEGAERIRELKVAIRERLEHDHYMAIDGTDADHGEHTVVNLRAQSVPTGETGKGKLYARTEGDATELYFMDANGNETQLTSGGAITSELSSLLTTQGDVPYASADGVPAALAKGTAYQIFMMNAGATAPGWATLAGYSSEAAAGTRALRSLGTTSTTACAGNDSRLSNTRTPTDSTVSQAKLKTSIGSVSIAGGVQNLTLPGGQYGFYPQVYGENSHYAEFTASMCGIVGYVAPPTSYTTNIYLAVEEGRSYDVHARQRYVTSSGEVFWIFVLRDKATKDILAMYQAPDHPCFGNGGKPSLVQHPFPNYDESKHEIIVINPTQEEVDAMEAEAERGEDEPDKDLLQVIKENYEIDENATAPWPTREVTVGLPKKANLAVGEVVAPIKKKIPKPDFITAKRLKRKSGK